ncbi:TetR/AcrR family transcriptional regulator [Actinospica robiniae]|uniref:TetR/AcrR family transcriptional regulator n=1 Tax=Actinospica robiniae TaxID=304901 RepID=UPI0007C5AE82|nr:TetR/AcrR family transcriptional regulator [Actinospica robiniae]
MSNLSGDQDGAPGRDDGDRQRRRRSDADRSVAAILDAAAKVLARDPGASMAEIAKAAGLTRQTVYAHFPSRDALSRALTDRATDRVTAALEAVDLSRGSAAQALQRLIQISWEAFESEPALLDASRPARDPHDERQRHEPVSALLRELVERGQREGDFDPALPTSWIIAATIALGHAAGEEVRAERLTSSQAGTALRQALRQGFAAPSSP